MDTRGLRKRASGTAASKSRGAIGCYGWRARGRREIRRAAIRKVRLRDSLECIIARAAACAAQVGDREHRPVTALSAVEACSNGFSCCWVCRDNIDKRSPRESRVEIEDAAERPATGDLFHPAVAAVEEDGLPHSENLKCLADVVVRAPILPAEIKGVGLLRIRCGACIHALRPGELSIGLELVRKLML